MSRNRPSRPSVPTPAGLGFSSFFLRTLRQGSRVAPGVGTLLSHTMYSSISFGKSTPPQNRRHYVSTSTSKQQAGNFVGELTF
jgi:hypothetical protein